MKAISQTTLRLAASMLGVALCVDGLALPTALAQPRPAPDPTAAAKSTAAPRTASSGTAQEMDALTKEGQELLEKEGDLDTIVARNQFIKGVNLAKQEQWNDAYPPLIDAWKHKKHWQIALNLGRVEFELGKFRDAAAHFEFVLRAPELARPASGPDPRADDRSVAVVWLAKSKSKMAYILVDASPPGAYVLVDGVPAGKVPLQNRIGVDPGKHTVKLRFGGSTQGKDVDLQSGDEVTVTLKASVASDIPAPVDAAPSPPVEHTAEPFPTRPVLLATSLALTITGLAVGGVSVGLASDYGRIAASEKQGPEGRYAVAEAQNKGLALWSFLGAALVGGAGITYYVMSRAPAGPVQAKAVAGPDGGSLVLSGRF